MAQHVRPPVALLDQTVARSDTIVRMCGWCKRIEVDGVWLDVEDALSRNRMLGAWPVPAVSHGACDACADVLEALIDD